MQQVSQGFPKFLPISSVSDRWLGTLQCAKASLDVGSEVGEMFEQLRPPLPAGPGFGEQAFEMRLRRAG